MSQFTDQSMPRRSFLRGHFLSALQDERVKQQGHNAIRPPWVNFANFLEKCTACGDCITACETHIIVKGASDYPEIDFSKGECTFCQACVQACKEDIFRPVSEPAWQHKIEIQANCIAHSGIECRSCEDSCEARSIRFKRVLGGISMPMLDLDSCTGCGACIQSCPVDAMKIIHPVEQSDVQAAQ